MKNWEIIWENTSIHTTMHELLDRTRLAQGIALDVCGEKMDYQAFHERSDLFASWIRDQVCIEKSVIIVSMKASADLFCMIAGVMKAGFVVLVTEDEIPDARLQKIYEQSGAQTRITDSTVRKILSGYQKGEDPIPPVQIGPGDVYAIWYTSGTTGEPCGIQTTAYNTVCNIIPEPGNEILSGALKESSALISLSHPSFGVGFTNFYYALFYGIPFVHVEPGRADTLTHIAEKIREYPGSFLLFTPSAMIACMDDPQVRGSLSLCSAVMMGADTVRQSLIDEIQTAMGPKGKVVNLYGISDVGLVAAKIAGPDDKLHAIGRPTRATTIYAVDDDHNPLPAGSAGEICVSGVRVGPGYLNASAFKQNKFVHNADGTKYFYTGDYGYIGEDGEVYLLGRMDRRIKHMGFRVDPVEIEEAMKKEAGIKGAAVKQISAGAQKLLAAFYENPQPLDPDLIRKKIAQVLPRYSLPERYIYRESLPLTDRGKLDYKALELTPEELRNLTARSCKAPQTPEEKAICHAFEHCLKIKQAGTEDSFFELGGDSLSGMTVLAFLKMNYQLEYTIDDIFQNPRPCELAALLGRRKDPEAEMPREGARTSGSFPPSLPESIRAIRDREDIEKVYPAETASVMYLFLQEAGTTLTKGLTFDFNVKLKRSFTQEEFETELRRIVHRHPALRSYFVKDEDGKWWQIFLKKLQVPVYYRNLAGMKEEAQSRMLEGFFQVMDETGAPFQAACFPIGDGKCRLLLRMTHTYADALSARQIVRELADGTDSEKTDRLYDYREKRLRGRDRFPAQLQDYYQSFGTRMRLPVSANRQVKDVSRREIRLTKEETDRLKDLCARMGLTFQTFVEYSFGQGLMAAMRRDDIWFTHLFSGRTASFERSDEIVGNLIYTLPVYQRKNMPPEEFQTGLLRLMEYPWLVDTKEYRKLNSFRVEEGIISRVFHSFGEQVLSLSGRHEENYTGHYMELQDGCLVIVFRYPGGEEEEKSYDCIEKKMREMLID